MIEYKKLSDDFKVRKLMKEDIPKILNVYESNPLYYRHCPPFPTERSIIDDMSALPPHKNKKDKYYIGFFEGDELIAIMDIIENYPNDKTIFWGLFMVSSNKSGVGLGSKIVENSLTCLKNQGFQYVRLAYMKTNPQSKAFWEKCKFSPTGVETDNGQGMVVVMEKELL